MVGESPLLRRNLNTEPDMSESVTEEIPITPETADTRSEISENGTSFNTTTSMGETGEPTLGQILDRVCKLQTVTQLEEYLKILHISTPEEFALAEQEDFHSLVQDIGRVSVRKLMILSNYCKVHDTCPPINFSISQIKKDLKETGKWEEQLPIPQNIVQAIGITPENSSCNDSVVSSMTKDKETYVLKEAGSTIVKLKEYSGDNQTWIDWYTAARGDLGNNRWFFQGPFSHM